MSQAAQPFVGKQLSERTYTVSEALLADYYNGLQLDPRSDGLIPTTVASDAENGYFGEIAFPNHVGHLWMRQGWECFGSMRAAATYTSTGRIRDIYPHRDRSVVYYEVDVMDASGDVVVPHPSPPELPRRKAGPAARWRSEIPARSQAPASSWCRRANASEA